jgi:2,3-dimethylmalate lyase
MNHGATLKDHFRKKRILPSLGVFDALSARIVEQAGLPSVYITGYGAAASHLGVPDIGLMSMSEMVDHVRRIAGAVRCPVIADADTGYGGPANVWRTVRDYEAAGVDLIQLEDQEWPKKCGHMEGKHLVPADEMIRRIRVAVRARRTSDFLIMARTDAIAVAGFEEAIRRAEAYWDAGADVLFVEAPRNDEELAAIPARLPGPCLANMVEGGKTPFKSVPELQSLGYAIALYPISTLLAAAHKVRTVADTFMKTSTTGSLVADMMDFSDFNQLVGLEDFMALQND